MIPQNVIAIVLEEAGIHFPAGIVDDIMRHLKANNFQIIEIHPYHSEKEANRSGLFSSTTGNADEPIESE